MNNEAHPFVSVIIPTYNRKDYLTNCIESLFSQTYQKDRYEIIVVDDGSTDGTFDRLKEIKKLNKIKIIHSNHYGKPKAINLGCFNSKGDIIIVVDDDCTLAQNYLDNLTKAYAHDSTAAVGGEIVPVKVNTLSEKYIAKKDIINQSKYPYFLYGAGASYRKDVLKMVGGFDDFFSKSAEDVDISFRIQLKGYKIESVKDAIIYHNHRSTVMSLVKSRYLYGTGFGLLHKKYPKHFSPKSILIWKNIRIFYKLVFYPYLVFSKARRSQEKKYFFVEPILDILSDWAYIFGIIHELHFNNKRPTEVIEQQLDFLAENELNLHSISIKLRTKLRLI